ncbi:MAG: Crp/Fnr family transcriptional regulator [Bacteroidota bacterium]
MKDEKQDLAKYVRQIFPSFSERDLDEEIVKVGTHLQFEAGEVLMDYGAFLQSVPLVLRGSVKVVRQGEDGNELLLYYLKGGETCSMSFSCCMSHRQSIIRAVTEEATELIMIPVKYVDLWMREYHSWKNFIMSAYDARIYELVLAIDGIAFKKMDERLYDYLQKKASIHSSHIIQSTHQDIAYDLNASREGISRLLKQLEKMGKVKLSRNQIELVAW